MFQAAILQTNNVSQGHYRGMCLRRLYTLLLKSVSDMHCVNTRCAAAIFDISSTI